MTNFIQSKHKSTIFKLIKTSYNAVMKTIALIGETASGKTKLALQIAQKLDAYILSLDSLSIYKEFNIVSAKPTMAEQSITKHFGLDLIYADEPFNVTNYISYYESVLKQIKTDKKNLVIVGGTSFYLKMLLNGISDIPNFTTQTKQKVKEELRDIENAYNLCKKIDPALNIEKNDKFRIEKNLLIYFQTDMKPTEYLKQNKKEPIIKECDIYQIDISKAKLKENITKRTKEMLKLGLVDEIRSLDQKYNRALTPMRAVGVIESLQYIDRLIDYTKLEELIINSTSKLAKRQRTFNKTQFNTLFKGSSEDIQKKIYEV